MPSTTGIELGPDSCVLTGVRVGRRGPEIFAVHVVEPAAWPGQDLALAELLRSIRRRKKLPRTARVVAWGLPEGAHAGDPVTRAALRPLVAAGFRIDAVLSPPQALARLAALRGRTGEGGIAWLALNVSGVAIAIVRGSELLFSRAFEWSFQTGPWDTRAELLQRYSLVSHLAPEVQRGISMVKASHGVVVDTAITCGDLPDLRSLTMPLIEELDLEVETLDSADGLRASGAATMNRLIELAPAVRLASAAATAKSQRRGVGPLVRVAAAAVLLVGMGWAGYTYWALSSGSRRVTTPVIPRATAQTPARPTVPPPTDRVEASPSQQVPRSPADTPRGSTVQATTGSLAQPKPASPGPARSPAPVPARDVPGAPVARQVTREPAPAKTETAPLPKPLPVENQTPAPKPADPVVVRPPTTRIVPLNEPVPVVDSILVDQNRRLAIVGGSIVSVGDRVGSRTVTQIERDFVVLREPSGMFVRVQIRGK